VKYAIIISLYVTKTRSRDYQFFALSFAPLTSNPGSAPAFQYISMDVHHLVRVMECDAHGDTITSTRIVRVCSFAQMRRRGLQDLPVALAPVKSIFPGGKTAGPLHNFHASHLLRMGSHESVTPSYVTACV